MGKLTLHPPAGASIAFDADEVSVGRDPQNDFVIPDGSVSRRHARLVRRGASWAVVDQGSANGTFLDSHRVSDAALRHGQELRFGVMPFRIELDTAAGAAAPQVDAAATVVQAAPIVPTATDATVPPPSAPPPAVPPLPPAAPSRLAPRSAGSPAPAPGPARRGRGPLFWIGLGCGGCLTILLGFCALLGGGLYFVASGPVNVVETHVALARDGQLDAAYAQLGEDLRQRLPPDEYAALVSAHPGLHENAEVRAWPPSGSVNRVNDRAQVTALLVARSGARERLTCELQQEGGGWKITALSVEPAS